MGVDEEDLAAGWKGGKEGGRGREGVREHGHLDTSDTSGTSDTCLVTSTTSDTSDTSAAAEEHTYPCQRGVWPSHIPCSTHLTPRRLMKHAQAFKVSTQLLMTQH